MTRKLSSFRRADGVHELAVIGGYGLAHAYNSSEKVSHFIEDEEVGRDTIDSDSYYVQLDGGYTLAAYKDSGVHLIRNIEIGEEIATYEEFIRGNDRDDEDDWYERECPAFDFPDLLDREKLIPMKKATQA